MSSNINSKDIINKQKEKYATSSWNKFLAQEFDKPDFSKFLDNLIDNVGKGISFSPAMKDWFKDFQSVALDDLKVVFVSTQEISIEKKEELNQQGIMFFTLARTNSNGEQQLDQWRMFNIYFIDFLLSNKKDLVYVFVGFDAQQFGELVTEDEYGYKIFLPETQPAFWDTKSSLEILINSINSLLESRDIEAINW